MWETLEHVHPPFQHLFSELYRVLKPGAIFLGSTPNLANLRKRLFLLLGKSPYAGFQFQSTFPRSDPLREYYASRPFTLHIREFTPEEVRQFLGWAGFRETEVSTEHMQVYVRLAFERGRPLRMALVRIYRLAGDLLGVRDTVIWIARKPGIPPTAAREDKPAGSTPLTTHGNAPRPSPGKDWQEFLSVSRGTAPGVGAREVTPRGRAC